jgi:hypothetical protein
MKIDSELQRLYINMHEGILSQLHDITKETPNLAHTNWTHFIVTCQTYSCELIIQNWRSVAYGLWFDASQNQKFGCQHHKRCLCKISTKKSEELIFNSDSEKQFTLDDSGFESVHNITEDGDDSVSRNQAYHNRKSEN